MNENTIDTHIAAYQIENEQLRRDLADMIDKIGELEDENQAMREVLEKYIPGCEGCEITFAQEAQALLSPTPAVKIIRKDKP